MSVYRSIKIYIKSLNIKLSCREDNYKKTYDALLIGGNIFVDDKNQLPQCGDKYINFVSDYSITYDHHSKGKVNTRFRYPYGGSYKSRGIEGTVKIYAKLNWWQRQILSIIEKTSVFHKHPIASIGLIFNFFIGVINIAVGYVNIISSVNSPNEDFLKQQTEILKQQTIILREISKPIELDTLKKEESNNKHKP